jgi:hypothetical protein
MKLVNTKVVRLFLCVIMSESLQLLPKRFAILSCFFLERSIPVPQPLQDLSDVRLRVSLELVSRGPNIGTTHQKVQCGWNAESDQSIFLRHDFAKKIQVP